MRIVIIGAGEVGYHIASRLLAEDKDVVFIDKDQDVLDQLVDRLDVETICGSGSSPQILEDAGIQKADMLMAVTDSDEVNLIACTFSNILAPNLIRVARVRNPDYNRYKNILAESLKIDIVVNPEDEVVGAVERVLKSPGTTEISLFSNVDIQMAAVRIQAGSPISNMSMAQLKASIETDDFIVAAILREDGLIIPTGQDSLQPGDMMYFVCAEKDLSGLLKSFGVITGAPNKIMIIGGGKIGFKLAQTLEKHKGISLKIVDLSRERCDFLAEHLSNTIVLNGDGRDRDLLHEENIADMDVLISLTGDEENNILCSLLAKSLGLNKTVTRINKLAYLPLMQALGLENIVSPRLATANSILRYVRQGNVISSISIKEEAEVLEAVVEEDSAFAGKPLQDVNFPKGCIVIGQIRGEEIVIPSGASVLKPRDRIMILAIRKKIPQVEKMLKAKAKG
ncbi:MAG: Trk system potassium transporter TrkA [Desulfohalobiaceae bacterium]|nr:Trk system potassium transporter TrkA [Desulfohalobiaceae bacterium]